MLKKKLIYLIFLIVAACSQVTKEQAPVFERNFTCDAEQVNDEKWKFSESSGKNIWFQNVDTRTKENFYSGEFAVLLSPEKPYGFTTEIDSILPDDYIQVKVWRNSENSEGVVVFDGGNGVYFASKEIVKTAGNGWQQLLLEVFIPPDFNAGKAKIFVWNNGQGKAFFDDLEIIHRRNKEFPKFDSLAPLQLFADTSVLKTLEEKRLFAYKNGVLENEEDDYSSLFLFDGNDFLNADFRLKGDLVDHLKGRKWSFRIKLKSGFSWKNMITFSVHNPIARDFLSEWFAHQIFMQEDILTTRYGFVPVHLNGESLGIYAWEEHFEKQLVESKNRREGPILKFDESIFWDRVLQTKLTGREWNIDYFDAANIVPFKSGKTVNDTALFNQFLEGQKLMQQYRNFELPVSKIFDIDKLAKYYALIDFTKAYHGFTWHNQRFYYNPVSCLLEPIAFDGYIEGGVYQRIEEPLTSLLNPQKLEGFAKEELLLYQVFADEEFNNKYLAYLQKYANNDFASHIQTQFQTEIDSLEEIIQTEFPAYYFDNSFLAENARVIRENLNLIQNNCIELGRKFEEITKHTEIRETTSDVNRSLIKRLVHANFDSESGELEVTNFHGGEISILGVKNEGLSVFDFGENYIVSAYGSNQNSITISVPEFAPDSVVFFANGQQITTEINPWPKPQGYSSRQSCQMISSIENLPVKSDSIIFNGNYNFETDVVIPKKFKVFAKAGTKINLLNGAGFISFAAIEFLGTENNPIEITSGDKSANAFNIIQPNGKSKLEYVHFSGLSSLQKKGWQTPAAVTFYEADVDLKNCIFGNNINCDDALNVVRSNFSAINCRFENTFADAFDSDFCTGRVTNCIFENIGNDAIDFSGSNVKITGCKMIEISDKAISGGEHSFLTVSDCEIEKANIGVASKDLSHLELDKITMNKTVYGIVAFVKKPEYGPASITIDNLKMKSNVVFHQIELGSVLTLNGKTINGREKNLALKLYQ